MSSKKGADARTARFKEIQRPKGLVQASQHSATRHQLTAVTSQHSKQFTEDEIDVSNRKSANSHPARGGRVTLGLSSKPNVVQPPAAASVHSHAAQKSQAKLGMHQGENPLEWVPTKSKIVVVVKLGAFSASSRSRFPNPGHHIVPASNASLATRSLNGSPKFLELPEKVSSSLESMANGLTQNRGQVRFHGRPDRTTSISTKTVEELKSWFDDGSGSEPEIVVRRGANLDSPTQTPPIPRPLAVKERSYKGPLFFRPSPTEKDTEDKGGKRELTAEHSKQDKQMPVNPEIGDDGVLMDQPKPRDGDEGDREDEKIEEEKDLIASPTKRDGQSKKRSRDGIQYNEDDELEPTECKRPKRTASVERAIVPTMDSNTSLLPQWDAERIQN